MNRYQKLAASIGIGLLAGLGLGQAKAFLERNPGPISAPRLIELRESLPESELRRDLDYLITRLELAKTPDEKAKAQALTREYLNAAAFAEGIKADAQARETVTKIKKDPTFAGQKSFTGSDWLTKLMKRLTNVKPKNVKFPEFEPRPASDLERWRKLATLIAILIMSGILITVLIALIKLVGIRRRGIAAKARLSKRGGMLEEGEVLLAEDEYLRLADDLIAQGKFRDASRMLYLAILLRSDSLRICRFDAAQTNWEHNARFEASRRRPSDLQIRSATQAFDLAWYGFRARSLADIEVLRTTYLSLRACKPVEVPV